MPLPELDAETIIRLRLAETKLPARDDEIADLVAAYPQHRAMIDLLYSVPEAKYEAPALLFNPLPVFADWA
jgi:hypothetical protein